MNDLKSANNNQLSEEWYKELVEECKAIITESVFTSRWALVEGYHELGKRIEEEVKQRPLNMTQLFQDLGKSISNCSKSTFYYSHQFYKKYPDLQTVPEGKNITWNKIVTKYLPNTSGVHVGFNSGENEWNTPTHIIKLAKATMGSIDTDPASNPVANDIIGATKFYTEEDNGLLQKWSGNVWMNPPYSQPLIQDFTSLLVKKYIEKEIQQALVLVNNATETVFYQNMLKVCTGVCFIKSRVKFINKDGQANGIPLQGQTVLYFGKNKDKFKQNFNSIGIILWTEE